MNGNEPRSHYRFCLRHLQLHLNEMRSNASVVSALLEKRRTSASLNTVNYSRIASDQPTTNNIISVAEKFIRIFSWNLITSLSINSIFILQLIVALYNHAPSHMVTTPLKLYIDTPLYI